MKVSGKWLPQSRCLGWNVSVCHIICAPVDHDVMSYHSTGVHYSLEMLPGTDPCTSQTL